MVVPNLSKNVYTTPRRSSSFLKKYITATREETGSREQCIMSSLRRQSLSRRSMIFGMLHNRFSLDLLRPERKEKIDDTLVGQRRNVADVLVADRDLSQHSSHYFAGTSFRQTWSVLDHVRLSEWTDSLANCWKTKMYKFFFFIEIKKLYIVKLNQPFFLSSSWSFLSKGLPSLGVTKQ